VKIRVRKFHLVSRGNWFLDTWKSLYAVFRMALFRREEIQQIIQNITLNNKYS